MKLRLVQIEPWVFIWLFISLCDDDVCLLTVGNVYLDWPNNIFLQAEAIVLFARAWEEVPPHLEFNVEDRLWHMQTFHINLARALNWVEMRGHGASRMQRFEHDVGEKHVCEANLAGLVCDMHVLHIEFELDEFGEVVLDGDLFTLVFA